MTFLNRKSKKFKNGVLYVRINSKRISTKLEDTPNNRKLVTSYYKNDEFFKKFDINKSIPSVLSLCKEVLDEKEQYIKPTSYRVYLSLFTNKIESFFKDMLIVHLDPLTIDKWYKTFNDRSTLNVCNSMMKAVIEKAIIRKYITQTPLVVKKPKFTSSYEMNPFTLEEINLLISKANRFFEYFIAINFYTGLRTGELLGLKWSDIDFDNYTIAVNRTRTYGYELSPKTKSSIRVIDMIPQCEDYLRLQQRYTGLNEYVFLTQKNKPFHSSSALTYDWRELLRVCGLELRGIYQLRHSFASNMLSNGEEILWVSSMLGHKTANITLEKYTKYFRKKRLRKKTFLDSDSTKLAH